MTPNPLIKNSFASPVKAQFMDRSANAELATYQEPSTATAKFSK